MIFKLKNTNWCLTCVTLLGVIWVTHVFFVNGFPFNKFSATTTITYVYARSVTTKYGDSCSL